MNAADRRTQFEEFARANPTLLAHLESLALDARRRGAKVGVRMLWEVCRWDAKRKIIRIDPKYRLNDHLTAEVARYLNGRPGLEGYFQVRDRKPRPKPSKRRPRVEHQQEVLL